MELNQATALTLNVRPCFPSSHHQDVGPCFPLLPAHLRTELSGLFAQSLPVVPEYQIRSWKRARVLNTACSVRVPFGLFCSILRFDEGIFYFALFPRSPRMWDAPTRLSSLRLSFRTFYEEVVSPCITFFPLPSMSTLSSIHYLCKSREVDRNLFKFIFQFNLSVHPGRPG